MISIYDSFVKIMDFFGRHRIIYDRIGNEPYLERFYVFLKDRHKFPFNIFIHKFLKSDPDDMHDHPWSFRTFILSGGYWEHTEEGTFWRRPFSTRYADANTFHRIELDKTVPTCWTLFIPYSKQRDWGFKTKDGWIESEKYFVIKRQERLEKLKEAEELKELKELEELKELKELEELKELNIK